MYKRLADNKDAVLKQFWEEENASHRNCTRVIHGR